MTKIGPVFKFAAPDGWRQFQEGGRQIFHGPGREELIVAAALIQGIGTTGDLAAVQRRLFQNAEQSVKNAAARPALKVVVASGTLLTRVCFPGVHARRSDCRFGHFNKTTEAEMKI